MFLGPAKRNIFEAAFIVTRATHRFVLGTRVAMKVDRVDRFSTEYHAEIDYDDEYRFAEDEDEYEHEDATEAEDTLEPWNSDAASRDNVMIPNDFESAHSESTEWRCGSSSAVVIAGHVCLLSVDQAPWFMDTLHAKPY